MSTATATVAGDPLAKVRNAIRRISALATLPEITTQIIATVEDPRSSAGKLHQIIAHDPALVTRILKVVNSAFYGLPGQIASVERAIVLLGLNAVKNIAVAASLGQLFRSVKICEGVNAKDLWTHCIAVAVATRDLAKIARLPLADEAFLAGMIHDMGILVELQTWPEQVREVCKTVMTRGDNFCQTERQLLGFDHQLVGKALAEQWKFPAACQQVAGFHHNPSAAGPEASKLVRLVYIADTIACRTKQGFSLTAFGQPLDDSHLTPAGIDAATVEKVAAGLPKGVAEALTVFK